MAIARGTVDNQVDLAAVVEQRKAEFVADPSDRTARRLQVALSQLEDES